MSTDPLVRSTDARQQRVSALFAADSGHVDLDALVRARSLDGSGRGAAPGLNRRFAVATVQQVVQANRREQVAALWASHDVVAAASAPDGADGSWRDAREAAAEKQRLRQAHLAAAREEEERLQQEEDAAARQSRLQGGGGGAADVLLPVVKRGRGGVGAEALSDSEGSGGSGSAKRRRKDAKRKSKKSKKSKGRKDGKERKHSRSP